MQLVLTSRTRETGTREQISKHRTKTAEKQHQSERRADLNVVGRCLQAIVHSLIPEFALLLLQVTGDDTTVIEAVLACDTERTQLLKEEQTLLKQLNKEAPDQAQAATANGHSATANGTAALPNGSSATAAESGATAADSRDSNGASGGGAAANGKAAVGKAADAAESKAAAQLAQVQSQA